MSGLLSACGFGSGILGAAGYFAGEMGIFSGKGTGALVGATVGGLLGYVNYSRNTPWNDEFYKIFLGKDYKNPFIIETGENRFSHTHYHGFSVLKKITPATFEEKVDRYFAIAFIAFSAICALCLDWSTVHMKADCTRHRVESCNMLEITESSIGLMVISGLFFAMFYEVQALLTKKREIMEGALKRF